MRDTLRELGVKCYSLVSDGHNGPLELTCE